MLLALNKPFHVLCQFTDRSVPPRRTLAEFGLPAGVYPAGRLDHDSEGLLLLTDDGALAHRITDPRHKLRKTYLVQVEGTPDDTQLQALREGVELNDGRTRSEEHTSELQSLMRISYAVFCLKKKKQDDKPSNTQNNTYKQIRSTT